MIINLALLLFIVILWWDLTKQRKINNANALSANKNFIALRDAQAQLIKVTNINSQNIQALSNHLEIQDSFDNDRDIH